MDKTHELIRELAQKTADAFGANLQDFINELKRLASSIPFDIEELKEYALRLQEVAKHEIEEITVEEKSESGWSPYSTKGKIGVICHPFQKRIYWHRIRSFCVRKNYH